MLRNLREGNFRAEVVLNIIIPEPLSAECLSLWQKHAYPPNMFLVRLSMGMPDSNIDIAVGARIRRLRNNSGLSRAQLSSSVSITEAELSLYEAGNARVPPEMLLRLADFFDVLVAAFFQDDE